MSCSSLRSSRSIAQPPPRREDSRDLCARGVRPRWVVPDYAAGRRRARGVSSMLLSSACRNNRPRNAGLREHRSGGRDYDVGEQDAVGGGRSPPGWWRGGLTPDSTSRSSSDERLRSPRLRHQHDEPGHLHHTPTAQPQSARRVGSDADDQAPTKARAAGRAGGPASRRHLDRQHAGEQHPPASRGRARSSTVKAAGGEQAPQRHARRGATRLDRRRVASRRCGADLRADGTPRDGENSANGAGEPRAARDQCRLATR